MVGNSAGLGDLSSVEYSPTRFRLMDLKQNLAPLKAIVTIVMVVRFIVFRAEYAAFARTKKVGIACFGRRPIVY